MKRELLAGLAILALTCKAQSAVEAPVDRAIAESSDMFAIPQSWIRAVIAVESAGNPGALSRSGAIGLMQLMPRTWTVLRERLHLGSNPFDPHDNVIAGTALLRELYDRFGSGGFLAAYNASPERYLDYLTKGRPLTDETRWYLVQIAPLLGDTDLGRAVAAPGTSPNWQAPTIFVARQAVTLQGGDRSSASNANIDPAPAPSRFQPQSGGLFAAISEGVTP